MDTNRFTDYLKSVAATQEHLRHIPVISDLVIRAWEMGGLLSPTFNVDGTIARFWFNVVAHQAGVTRVACGIGKQLAPLLEDEGVTVGDIALASLAHDSFKRREQEIRDRAKDRNEDVAAANRSAESEGEVFLTNLHFPERIAHLASHTGDRGLEHLRKNKDTVTLAEKIVFYADCTVSNYDIVGYKRRFDDLLPKFEPGGIYEALQADYLTRYGRTHREVWDETVLPIQEELAKHIFFRGNPDFLAQFVTGTLPC